MKRLTLALFAILATLIISLPALAQDATEFEQLTGIPVMDGLVEKLDQRVVFDKVGGRILRAGFTGSASGDDVLAFYRGALVQLGWEVDVEGLDSDWLGFISEDERLNIIIESQHPLKVRLELRPLS